MHRSTFHTGAFLLFLSLWASTPARSEPIQVTAGSLVIARPDGQLNLIGDRGFALDAHVHTGFGVWSPEMEGCTTVGCGAGPLSLYAHWSGTDVHGVVSFDGWIEGLRMDGPSTYLEFFSSVMVPHPDSVPVTLSVPFTFSGLLITGVVGERTHDLFGYGLASVVLEPYVLQGSQGWLIRNARYDFTPNPIPEPSTLVLLGSCGAAFVAHRIRSRRRGRHDTTSR